MIDAASAVASVPPATTITTPVVAAAVTSTAVAAVAAAPVTVAVTAPETTAAAVTAITTSAEDKEVADLASEVISLKAAGKADKALIDATVGKLLDAKYRAAIAAKGIAST